MNMINIFAKTLLVIFAFCRNISLEGSDIHFCAVASHETKGLSQLVESCDHFQIPLVVLGLGKPYLGNSQKLLYLREHLNNLPEDDIIVFVDAYDVLFLESGEEIKRRFLEMGAPFVISVERYCWPFPQLEEKFPRGPTSFRYINSGSFIGYVGAVAEILDEIDIRPYCSDQGLFTLHYFKRPELYTFDPYCLLFMPLAGVIPEELHIDAATTSVELKATKIAPCLIHGNGGSKPLYQEIYEKLFDQNLEPHP